MLIERLREYAERTGDRPPPMYQMQPIRYRIALDRTGRYLGKLDTADASTPATKRGKQVLAPHIKRTMGVKPKLLVDTAPYVLGVGGPDAKPVRVREQHRAFVELIDRCEAATAEPALGAVKAFLHAGQDATAVLPADVDWTSSFGFDVEGVHPESLPAVQRFWATETTGEADDTSSAATRLVCVGCGRLRPALERHPLKIKGIPGGQIVKDLISANADAFLSYGLKASQVAPMCQECAEAYGNALNRLLGDRETSFRVGDSAYAFWTAAPVTFDFMRLLSQDEPEQVKALLASVRSGQRADEAVDATAFYAVGLGASGARVVVRDWIDTTVGRAKERVAVYFASQELVDAWGAEANPLPLFRLIGATVRDPRKESAPPMVARALLRFALVGEPVPMDVVALAVRRNRADQGVSRERAALIKLALVSHASDLAERGAAMAELELTNREPAYLCGRLLAVLDVAQQRAIPGANTTIVDKFYGTASSAPATVFGTLLHGAQAHLGKLQRDRPGTHKALERTLEEVLAGLTEFPKTLTLEQQGLFALGFYHQRAADRKAARERSEQRAQASDDNAAETK